MKAKSAILTYHSLDETGSVISTAPETFRRQIETLVARKIPVVPLSRVASTPGAVAITFDDGFRNFLEHAAPVLTQYRLPATVFVVSAYCGRQNSWPQFVTGIPRLDLMTWNELNQLPPDLIALGAHTVNHADLSKLPEAQIREELRPCRLELEERTGRTVETFAYPYGSSTPRIRELVAGQFKLCCGTTLRFLTPAADLRDMPRIDTYYLRTGPWFDNLMTAGGSAYIGLRGLLRSVRGRFFQ